VEEWWSVGGRNSSTYWRSGAKYNSHRTPDGRQLDIPLDDNSISRSDLTRLQANDNWISRCRDGSTLSRTHTNTRFWMVTDQQVRRLRRFDLQGLPRERASDKAGIDPKTARKYRRLGKLPSEVRSPETRLRLVLVADNALTDAQDHGPVPVHQRLERHRVAATEEAGQVRGVGVRCGHASDEAWNGVAAELTVASAACPNDSGASISPRDLTLRPETAA
jgi:hypothetical protein